MKKMSIIPLMVLIAALTWNTTSFAVETIGPEQRPGSERVLPGYEGQPPGVPPERVTQTQVVPESLKTVFGKSVRDINGKEIGKLEDVVVRPEGGELTYALVVPTESTKKYVIPWRALTSQPQSDSFTVNVPREKLMTAPKYQEGMSEKEFGRNIHEYYGITPYWE